MVNDGGKGASCCNKSGDDMTITTSAPWNRVQYGKARGLFNGNVALRALFHTMDHPGTVLPYLQYTCLDVSAPLRSPAAVNPACAIFVDITPGRSHRPRITAMDIAKSDRTRDPRAIGDLVPYQFPSLRNQQRSDATNQFVQYVPRRPSDGQCPPILAGCRPGSGNHIHADRLEFALQLPVDSWSDVSYPVAARLWFQTHRLFDPTRVAQWRKGAFKAL